VSDWLRGASSAITKYFLAVVVFCLHFLDFVTATNNIEDFSLFFIKKIKINEAYEMILLSVFVHLCVCLYPP
jgi:hypothetical protein